MSSGERPGDRARILIVEDEAIVARDLERSLHRLGYDVFGIESRAEDAVARVGRDQPELVLMDIRLRGPVDGIEAAREIWRRFEVPTVFLTAYADDETVARAKGAGTFGYLVKPFDPRELRATIEVALERGAEGRAAEARERRFFELFSRLGDGVVLIDPAGRIARLNEAGELLFGRSAAELATTGIEARPFFDGEGEAAVLRRPDGETVAVRVCRLPFAAPDGAWELVVFRDPRAAFPAEQRLLRREVSALLKQLIGGVVHGVGNPLFVISSHLEMLDFEVDTAPAEGDVRELLQRQVDRIRVLLGYLAEYAVGGDPLAQVPVAIAPMVSEAVERAGAAAAERGIEIELDDRAGETRVNADPTALRAALDHLLANAIAFSPSPGAVRVTLEREEMERPLVHLRVDDSGPGIAPEDLRQVFAPFFSRRLNGTGLGLAVVRRVVEEHGGRVSAANRESGGARFTVSLPALRTRYTPSGKIAVG